MQRHRVSIAIVSLTFLLLVRFSSSQPPPQLYFSFISSSAGGFVTSGAIPGVDIALEQIAKSDVLRGYNLSYSMLDSKCDRTESLNVFFDAVQRLRVHVTFLGCGCSVATEPVAEIIHNWNISLVSYSSSDPGLSNRRRFPSFFRTYTSDENSVPAMVALVQQYRWKRIGILTEQENLFIGSLDLLRRRLMDLQVSVESRIFSPDGLRDILRNNRSMDIFLQEEDYRVLFLNMYSDSARIIICEAIRNESLTYPRYTWITYGWYQKEWYLVDDTDCTGEEFQEFLETTLVLESFPTAVNADAPTDTNLTLNQFFDKYEKKLRNNISLNFTFVAPAAYDTVWAIAFALNKTIQMVASADEEMKAQVCAGRPGALVPLEEFEYTNQCLGNLITRNINQTSFEGITGTVKFSPEDGTRIQNEVRILQYRANSRGLTREVIANTSILTSKFSYLNNESDSSVFPMGVVPDGTPLNVTETFHLALVIIYYILAALGLAFTAVCLMFNLVFRDRKIVRLTSPNLNYFILGGAAIMYVTVIIRLIPTTNGSVAEARCYIETWMITLGYSLAFATILAKMARVYQIFHDPKPNKTSFKDWQLILAILILVAVSGLLLVLGSSIPRVRPSPNLEINAEHPTGRDERGVRINYHVWGCYDDEYSIPLLWITLIFIYFAILQVIALVLAIQTRKVTVKVLNDSKSVAAIIYVTSIVLVVVVLVTIFLGSYNNIFEVLFSGGILLGASAVLGLIFVPKMVSLYRDPEGENIFTKSSNNTTTLEVSSSGAITLKMPSAATERERQLLKRVEELEEQLRNITSTTTGDSSGHSPDAQNSFPATKSGGLAPPTDTPPQPHNTMTTAL